MDHEWGRNVLEAGLGDTGCTLAARLPDPLGVATFYLTNEDVFNVRIWELPPDTAPDAPYFAFTLTQGLGNFPYGYPVVGDGPV